MKERMKEIKKKKCKKKTRKEDIKKKRIKNIEREKKKPGMAKNLMVPCSREWFLVGISLPFLFS